MSKLKMSLIKTRKDFQILDLYISGNGIIEHSELKETKLPKGINYAKGVIISGKVPVWLFAHLIHELHVAKWVATFDPRLGGVVVQSHGNDCPQLGDIIEFKKIIPYLIEHKPSGVKKKP